MSVGTAPRAARSPSAPAPVHSVQFARRRKPYSFVRHLPEVGAGEAVTIIFLDEPEHRVVHALSSKFKLCWGNGCPLCAHPNLKVQVLERAWHAPVLWHDKGDLLPDRSPNWKRFVLGWPNLSGEAFGMNVGGELDCPPPQPGLRRRCFRAWRKGGRHNGEYDAQILTQWVHDLPEPGFKVRPFVDVALAFPKSSPEADDARTHAFAQFGAVVPPVLLPPPRSAVVVEPFFTAERQAEFDSMRSELRALKMEYAQARHLWVQKGLVAADPADNPVLKNGRQRAASLVESVAGEMPMPSDNGVSPPAKNGTHKPYPEVCEQVDAFERLKREQAEQNAGQRHRQPRQQGGEGGGQ